MHILKFEAENIKKLRVVQITPKGHVVQITGANGSGKTSAIDAIEWALGGAAAIPSKPVRKGERQGRVRLDLGDMVVTRKISAEGPTSVVVENADGARFPSPQALLDKLYGKIAFDPLRFSRMEPRPQLETLRRLVQLDVDIDKLDALNKRDFDERTIVNREVKALTERVATLALGVVPDMDVTLEDVDAIVAEMEQASGSNASIFREEERRAELGLREKRLEREAERIQAEIDRLTKMLHTTQDARSAIELEFDRLEPLPAPVDTRELAEQIRAAQRENANREQQIRQRAAHQDAVSKLQAAQATSENLTADIDARTAEKEAAIANARMPVAGLGFGDGEVTYNGLPLEQASAAEQLRVSFAVAMAMNPKLKVVLIRDGSLLDEQSLALVAQMAEEHDYQVWLEKAEIGGKVGILLEQGEVVAIDGEPVEQPAEASV